MAKITQTERLLRRPRRLSVLLVGVTLLILAATILLASLQLRSGIREQIAGRDGEVLHAVALMQLDAEAPEAELFGSISDPANQLSVVVKTTSGLKGVVAARLFDADGEFVGAFPPDVRESRLDRGSLPTLRRLKPVSHFFFDVPLSQLFLSDAPGSGKDQKMPLLVVNVPLHTSSGDRLIGIAQFCIEGSGMAAEFSRLDRRLAIQALIAFFVGGGILLIAVTRLSQAQHLLAERTDSLLRANRELAVAAKTSAVGAITSHLIHGLKNPLSGLQTFVSGLAPVDAESPEADWHQAVAATERMQCLINQVINVLREEEGAVHYDTTLAELSELVVGRVRLLSVQSRVELVVHNSGESLLPNHTANLVGLILVNLVQNALQATPGGGKTTLTLKGCDENVVCEVRDEGPGLPASVTANLFAPCRSTKAGGSGIGLAISKQLASHLGAELELKCNSPNGCVFALTVPVVVPSKKTGRASSTLIC